MKKGINFGGELNKVKRNVGIALIILIAALVIFTVYYLFIYPKPCSDVNCFADAVKNCKHVSWIKEDAYSSWLYEIKSGSEEACNIKVTLLKMKEGTIESEKLQGKTMICSHLKGETQFPEKNIDSCTGILKEEMQGIIIERMHNYLLENVGEIKQEFTGV